MNPRVSNLKIKEGVMRGERKVAGGGGRGGKGKERGLI